MAARVVRLAIVGLAAALLGVSAYLAFVLLHSPAIRDVRGWELAGPLPNARGETATAVADGRLWLVGGLTGLMASPTDEVATYVPASGTWAAAPALPAPRHHAAATAGPDGTVYVSGGQTASGEPQPTFWSIRAGQSAWVTLPPMPEARSAHRMVTLAGKLYVIGGIGRTGRVLAYDPASRSWSAGAEMPAPRNHLGAVAVGGEIWAIGGRVNGRAQARVDIYDPRRDEWRSGPPLPVPTSGAAEGLLDQLILVSGGEDPQVSEDVIDRHWQLDTGSASPRWVPFDGPPLPVHGTQGGVIDGAFVIAGGAWRPGASSRFAWSNLTQVYRPGEG